MATASNGLSFLTRLERLDASDILWNLHTSLVIGN